MFLTVTVTIHVRIHSSELKIKNQVIQLPDSNVPSLRIRGRIRPLQRREGEEIANQVEEVQRASLDFIRFQRVVDLVAFKAFSSSEEALAAINDISEGLIPSTLSSFLTQNLPVKSGKKPKYDLGVSDSRLGGSLQDELGYSVRADSVVTEYIRGVRQHFSKFVDSVSSDHLSKAERGLGHSYSRAKVKFNVNRVDNMIIQTIALVDQLDKDINTFTMRLREWYGWHFPELAKIVPDSFTYVKIVSCLPDKSKVDDVTAELKEILETDELFERVVSMSKMSIGRDVSELDVIHIGVFSSKLKSLINLKLDLSAYLNEKMSVVAPNLSAVVGDIIGARLISHAGSLTNLSKFPASTVQILGAEKALFRALKTRKNTPKYGLLFHASAVGKAQAKHKGRMSRFVANKCSIASRMDCFQDVPNSLIGGAMRQQIDERLAFYEGGIPPITNEQALSSAIEQLRQLKKEHGVDDEVVEVKEDKKKKSKKEKKKTVTPDDSDKKEKKKRRSSEVNTDKKKKKKKEVK
ncbi:hypothetical protein GEMRC1_002922 [Eukaryota sp. GEM-RC1]